MRGFSRVFGAGLGLAGVAIGTATTLHAAQPDIKALRARIASTLDDNDYEDGSRGPVLVRLAWHCAGTYDAQTKTGGSNGGSMRFNPESNHGANSGLHIARSFLEPIKRDFPDISYADLYTLAGAVAVEHMGGPAIPWKGGRIDHADGSKCPPEGRLPDAAQGAAHVREVFGRMGFNDQEMVALIGAHALGRMHVDRSGYDGPWTNAPTTFSNEFFRLLLESKWSKRQWKGPEMFVDETGKLFMTPADLCFVQDPFFRKYVEEYARNEDKLRADFAAAFGKLLALGCDDEAAKGGNFLTRLLGK